jgi:hypothetical protein
MTPQWLEVDNWLDLVGNAWIGLVLIAVAAVPSALAARNHKTLQAVKGSVINNHKVPMREDLDRLGEAIELIAEDVRGLRKDLMAEEQHRRLQISDLRDDLNHRTGRHHRL